MLRNTFPVVRLWIENEILSEDDSDVVKFEILAHTVWLEVYNDANQISK
jgi:hypothetical protein